MVKRSSVSEFSVVLRPILPISVHTDSRSTIEILKKENASKKMTGIFRSNLSLFSTYWAKL